MAKLLRRLVCAQSYRQLWTASRNTDLASKLLERVCRYSSTVGATAAPSTNDDEIKDEPKVKGDPTTTMAKFKDTLCSTPREAQTNLLTFLTRSDVVKREKNIEIPYFCAGSYLRVTYADSGSHTGVNQFTGICIARSNHGIATNFILRNVIGGVGVERLFDLYSPHVQNIQVLKLERRRRAKLYYLRNKPLKFSTVSEKMKPVDSKGVVLKYRRKPGNPA